MSRLATISAAAAGAMVDVAPWLPGATFGSLALAAAAAAFFFLPETGGKPLPATMRDVPRTR